MTRSSLLAVVSFLSAFVAGEVFAQRTALEEVVVTARKRAESIQETPVAVTAISGDDLRAAGIVNAQELSKSVPSLQMNNSTNTQIFIRGIGQRSGLARQDPSVSVYLDGLFIPRPDGQLLDTIDIQNVQVLRGPQGTLFGKNNTGGALVFTLQKPDPEGGAYVDATLGSFNERRLQAGKDFAITDTLTARVSAAYSKRDGFLEDLSGVENQSVDRKSVIAQTRWELSESIVWDTFMFYGKIRERFPSYNCEVTNENALFINGLGLLWPGDTNPAMPTAYVDNCNANNRDNLGELETNQGPGQRNKKHLDDLQIGSTFDIALNDTLDLKVIVGLRDAVKRGPQTQADDGGPAGYQYGLVLGRGDQESATLEFQLNGSAFESKLEYTAGVFLQREYKTETFSTNTSLQGIDGANLAQIGGGLAPNPALVPPLVGSGLPIVGALVPIDTVQDFTIRGSTFAAFSQLTWNFSDNLELSIGGRYTEENRKSKLGTQLTDNAALEARIAAADPRFTPSNGPATGANPGQALLTFSGSWLQDPIGIADAILGVGDIRSELGPRSEDKRENTFREFTPMVSISYFFPDRILDGSFVDSALTYLTWSNGFKSGFLEPQGVDGLLVVEPETLENIETGVKLDMFERRLRLNVALYSMTFENQQLITVNVDSAGGLVVTSTNAGESMIEGGELELTWLPSAQWLLSFTYSNNNYKFEEFNDVDLATLAITGNRVEEDRSDEEFPVSPEKTASIGIQYTWNSPIGLLVPRIDISHKSEVYLGFDDGAWEVRNTNRDGVYSDAYELVDLRLSWRNEEGDLSVSGFVKNATDERYFIGAVATGDSIGTFTTALGDPRTFGINMRKTF